MNKLFAFLPYLFSVASPLLGVLAYRWRARVDLESKKEGGQIDAMLEPVRILKEELAGARTELTQMRADDKADRQAHLLALTSIQNSMETMAATLSASTAQSHAEIGEINKRLIVIETKLQVGQ